VRIVFYLVGLNYFLMSESTSESTDLVPEPEHKRLQRLFDDNAFIHNICIHVSNGGSLTEMCKAIKVRYSKIIDWIGSSEDTREKYLVAMAARDEWAKERILEEIRNIGLGNIKDLVDANGDMLPIKDMPDSATPMIAGIDVTEDAQGNITTKYKITDKLKALDMYAKKLGILVEKKHITTVITLEDMVSDSWDSK